MILADNGGEFSNPKCIENEPDGKVFQRTRIYYCNPSAPYQRAEIEVNHEFICRVVPKGKSFDELAQAGISLMMVHIIKRESRIAIDQNHYFDSNIERKIGNESGIYDRIEKIKNLYDLIEL